MATRAHQHDETAPGTALDALLQVESAVAVRLERARADAATLVEAAVADAKETRRQAHDALALELAELDAEQALALSAIDRDVAKSAADLVRHYRGISPNDTARWAAVVLAEVTGLSPTGSTVPHAP